jgi:transposase
MAYNFLRGDRDQRFLLPPDLRDWLPKGHLAWFVLDVVDQLDLGPFLRGYRADGHGHPAYDPTMLLGVLYAYAIGVRSLPQMERRCREDLAFRVLAGNQAPDHVTIARFRVRHQQALAGFLVASLRLCTPRGWSRSAPSRWTAARAPGRRHLGPRRRCLASRAASAPGAVAGANRRCYQPSPGWL